MFDDQLGRGLIYRPFAGSKPDVIAVDTREKYAGTASLRVSVPDFREPTGGWAGGYLRDDTPRDISACNALTFWAKADDEVTLTEAGFGVGAVSARLWVTTRSLTLATYWQRYVIPMPLPARLTTLADVFFFAASDDLEGGGHVLWFDEMRYETLDNVGAPAPRWPDDTLTTFVGDTLQPPGFAVGIPVGGVTHTMSAGPGYLTLATTDASVARIVPAGVAFVGAGTAALSGQLGDVMVEGSVPLRGVALPPTSAPVPGRDPADVLPVFSGVYGTLEGIDWDTDWQGSMATTRTAVVAGDTLVFYADMNFVGIDFGTGLDATAMTHLHLDVWAPVGTGLEIKLVDVRPNGTLRREGQVFLDAESTPPFTVGEWAPLDIPLADFQTAWFEHLRQLVLVSPDVDVLFVDNIYFHR